MVMSGLLRARERRLSYRMTCIVLALAGCGQSPVGGVVDAGSTADNAAAPDVVSVTDVSVSVDSLAPADAPSDGTVDAGAPLDVSAPADVAVPTVDTPSTPSDAPAVDACVRQCNGRVCGSDGCGGRCGECAPGAACTADGRCEANIDVVEVAAGRGHTCARRSTGAVLCWGRNYDGELADGTMEENQLRPRPVLGVTDAVELALGDYFTCARRMNGSVLCWGNNSQGQLGDGTDGNVRRMPVAVADLNDAVEIGAGASHACARRANGTMVCWGLGSMGQLGDGTTAIRRNRPVAVTGLSDVVQITVGSAHTCARRNSGSVLCWGRNMEGQLGDGTNEIALRTPTAVTGLVDADAIAAEGNFTCAIRAGALVSCWGTNGSGQLGDGTSGMNRNAPTLVPELSNVTRLALGFSHACALLRDGGVRCWGANDTGLVGDGTTQSPRLRPTAVVGLSDADAIAANGNTSCARRRNGAVLCWGNNTAGQLGDGMIGNTISTPTPVPGL